MSNGSSLKREQSSLCLVFSTTPTTGRTENPVSFNNGQRRPSWFDLHSLPPNRLEWDHQGITVSIARIESIIRAELMHGVDPRRILLVGFSQGAVLALLVALNSLLELGGIASLSGWLPQPAHQASTPSVCLTFGATDWGQSSKL